LRGSTDSPTRFGRHPHDPRPTRARATSRPARAAGHRRHSKAPGARARKPVRGRATRARICPRPVDHPLAASDVGSGVNEPRIERDLSRPPPEAPIPAPHRLPAAAHTMNQPRSTGARPVAPPSDGAAAQHAVMAGRSTRAAMLSRRSSERTRLSWPAGRGGAVRRSTRRSRRCGRHFARL
jgi:hypothetical protein